MTSNQIANRQQQEQVRTNQANEGIKRDTLKETRRHNRHMEATAYLNAGASAAKAITPVINDPSWYNIDKQMVKDAANLSFNAAIGSFFPVENFKKKEGPTITTTKMKRLPGVMAIHFTPTLGSAIDGTSAAVNLAAKNIYAWVRHANSGSRNYEAPDLMLYLLAMDSAYMWLAHLTRAYGIARRFDGKNRYLPEALLSQMGFAPSSTPGSILNNLSQFRAHINLLASRLSAFYVPKVMSLFERHSWLCSHVFKDASIAKSQFYVFTPTLVWMYDESSIGKLVPSFVGNGATNEKYNTYIAGEQAPRNLTLDGIIAISNSLIDKLINSEDIGIMSGDILKAYGESGLWKVGPVAEDYIVDASYSPEVLEQIHNATVWNEMYIPTLSITQNEITGDIQYGGLNGIKVIYDLSDSILSDENPQQTATASITPFDMNRYLLNLISEEPTPDNVMVSTRLMSYTSAGAFKLFSDTDRTPVYECIISEMGTEVVNGVSVSNCSDDSIIKYSGTSTLGGDFRGTRATALYYSSYPGQYYYSSYDWAPQMKLWYLSITTKTGNNGMDYEAKAIIDFTDYMNTTYVDVATLRNLHLVAVNSEFGIPLIGTKAK